MTSQYLKYEYEWRCLTITDTISSGAPLQHHQEGRSARGDGGHACGGDTMTTGVRASSIDKPLVRAERKNGNLYIGAQLWFLCLIEIDDRGRAASDCVSRADARDDAAAISACISSTTGQNVCVAVRHSST